MRRRESYTSGREPNKHAQLYLFGVIGEHFENAMLDWKIHFHFPETHHIGTAVYVCSYPIHEINRV